MLQETISAVLEKNLRSFTVLINIKTWILHYSVLLEFQVEPYTANIYLLKNKMFALILCHNEWEITSDEDILLP